MSLTHASHADHDDDRDLRSFGYEPQLNRSMGLLSSLSISISCMCITAGIFTVFAYSLGTVGPAFVWTWPIVAVGQIIVALVLADLAGRIPLSGYAFQWTSRLMSSHFGWFTGWAGLMAFTPGFTGLNLGLSPILLSRLGVEVSVDDDHGLHDRPDDQSAADQPGRRPDRVADQQHRGVHRRARPVDRPDPDPARRRVHHEPGPELQLPDDLDRR